MVKTIQPADPGLSIRAGRNCDIYEGSRGELIEAGICMDANFPEGRIPLGN